MGVSMFCIGYFWYHCLNFFLIFGKIWTIFKHLFTEVQSDKYKNLAKGLVLAQNYRQPQKITPNNVKLFLFWYLWDTSSIIAILLVCDSPTDISLSLILYLVVFSRKKKLIQSICSNWVGFIFYMYLDILRFYHASNMIWYRLSKHVDKYVIFITSNITSN